MRGLATAFGVGKFGLDCAARAWSMTHGGNQWAGFPAYCDFLREVARLPIDWSRWEPWRILAERSGPRIMHAEFCIVSDRPERLMIDAENRAHCDDGPFCRWRDGTALYMVHGVQVPAWIIECPERIDVAAIDAESNAEVRRVMLDRYGWARYIAEAGAEVVDTATDEIGEPLTLLRRQIPGDEPAVFVRFRNSTQEPDGSRREFLRRVPPETRTAFEARNWTCGLPPDARFTVQT